MYIFLLCDNNTEKTNIKVQKIDLHNYIQMFIVIPPRLANKNFSKYK